MDYYWKKSLFFLYFLSSTILNDLLFNFVRCALDPVLQEWVNKNLHWPVQMTLHKNHIQMWLVTILLLLSVSVVSGCIWRYIKLLESNLMSVILQTRYYVVEDHRSERQGMFLVQTGVNQWYSELPKVLVSIFVMNSQSEEEKWNIPQAPVIQLTIIAPSLNFFWKLPQTMT